MIILIRTDRFKKEYSKLPKNIKRITDNKLRFLVKNIHHPSLRVKKVKGFHGVFEGSITMNYRFFFQIMNQQAYQAYVLIRIGTHDELL